MRKLKKGVYYNFVLDMLIVIHDIVEVANSREYEVWAEYENCHRPPDIFYEIPLESKDVIYLGEL